MSQGEKMAERSFPIITFDTASVMQLLYSCAYARAAAMDALLIDEPTVMNSLFKYAMTPKRIGSLTEGDPQAFKRAVFLIYYRYQSTTVRSKAEQNQLVRDGLGLVLQVIGLQGA
jgi:hypothetical protein